MLCVKHEADIKQLCFRIGILSVGAYGAKNGFGSGKALLFRVEIKALAVILQPLYLISVAD